MREVFSGDTVSGSVKAAWSSEVIDTTLLADGVREFFDGQKYHYLNVQNQGKPDSCEVERWQKEWTSFFGAPADDYVYEKKCTLYKKFSGPGFEGELYRQNNAPGKWQQTMLLLPHKGKAPYPTVIMPFYVPARIIGFDPETGEEVHVEGRTPDTWNRGAKLAQAGFAVLTCTSYYRTYIQNDMPEGFERWGCAAEELLKDNPSWSGSGKLVYDNRLLVDLAFEDPRFDSERVAVMGHSLGGKIAFYLGCLDPRLKAAVASDWGMGWHQTNWEDIWYWGAKVKEMEKKNMEHSQLLALSKIPMLIIAGHYDNEAVNAFYDRAALVRNDRENLLLDDHKSGHRIPPESMANAIEFLKKYLNVKDL